MSIYAGMNRGSWTIIEKEANSARWLCECKCKTRRLLTKAVIAAGLSSSCGCARRALRGEHGMSKSGEYATRLAMINRCYNPKCDVYEYYGGRGITVCDEWRESFMAFYRDMGPRPPGASIDRIDNSKPYCKENCRWANRVEQANNKRSNVRLVAFGESKTASEWARDRRCAVSYATLKARLSVGIVAEIAITAPLRRLRAPEAG